MPTQAFLPHDEALRGFDVAYYCSGEGLPSLVDILNYHVIAAVVPSVQITTVSQEYATWQGRPLYLVVNGSNNILVNDATVWVSDLLAYNGIVHVIDTVLVPPS